VPANVARSFLLAAAAAASIIAGEPPMKIYAEWFVAGGRRRGGRRSSGGFCSGGRFRGSARTDRRKLDAVHAGVGVASGLHSIFGVDLWECNERPPSLGQLTCCGNCEIVVSLAVTSPEFTNFGTWLAASNRSYQRMAEADCWVDLLDELRIAQAVAEHETGGRLCRGCSPSEAAPFTREQCGAPAAWTRWISATSRGADWFERTSCLLLKVVTHS
jgi:hypothetical protein